MVDFKTGSFGVLAFGDTGSIGCEESPDFSLQGTQSNGLSAQNKGYLCHHLGYFGGPFIQEARCRPGRQNPEARAADLQRGMMIASAELPSILRIARMDIGFLAVSIAKSSINSYGHLRLTSLPVCISAFGASRCRHPRMLLMMGKAVKKDA